jgi:glycosyltransferase involved in cell wall biosynthesis
MHIKIDATSLLLPGAGVRNYLHYWLRALLEAAPASGDAISAYPPFVPAPSALDHEKPAAGPLRATAGLLLVQFANIRGNRAIDLLTLGADVFHCSQHTANCPARPRKTATVFDMSCWIAPQYHTPANVSATKRYGERILKNCDGAIAISGHARDTAAEILGIPAERIRAIYPGVAESFFEVSQGQADAVRARYALPAPYLLFVGCIEPRKNVPGLVRAYQQLPAALRRDVQLVLAGPFGWAAEETRQMLTHSGPSVRYLGYVPEPDLPGLSAGAAALIYPSYYEGFGLPVAQAMAAGVPVIASDRTCLPEMAGGAALLVDPDSAEEIGAAIARILTSPELARELARRGKARAREFHWSTAAARSLEFFHQVGGGR